MDFNPTLKDTTLPPGAVVAFAGKVTTVTSSPPNEEMYSSPVEAWGWMVCDGRSLKASEYPELFVALGYLYGGSDETFNIPDMRGMFLRGIGTQDAELEERKAAKGTGGTADGIGSTQDFAVQQHVHIYTSPNEPAVNNQGPVAGDAVLTINPQTATSGPVESVAEQPGNVKVSQYETRPTNTFVYYIIKYTSKLPTVNLQV